MKHVIFYENMNTSAVFFRDVANTLNPPAVIFGFLFRCLRDTVLQVGHKRRIVFDMYDGHIAAFPDIDAHDALLLVLDLFKTFDGVVDGIPQQRIDLIGCKHIQTTAVHRAYKLDIAFGARQRLFREGDVLRFVARIIHGLQRLHLLFELCLLLVVDDVR